MIWRFPHFVFLNEFCLYTVVGLFWLFLLFFYVLFFSVPLCSVGCSCSLFFNVLAFLCIPLLLASVCFYLFPIVSVSELVVCSLVCGARSHIFLLWL